MALGIEAFIDGALDWLFKALFVADKIDDRAALVGWQGLPLLFADALAALATGIADHDADGLHQLALPVGVGSELFETDAKGALLAVGSLGVGDAFKGDFVGVFPHRLLVGCGEDAELEEGIAQLFLDEVDDEGIDCYDAAQIYFNPPVVDRCLRIGFPEGGWIVVEDVGGGRRI